MKKIIIVISFLCVSLFTDAQLDITKRNITVTENFWKGGDSLYTAPEVDSRITVLEDLLFEAPFAPAVSPVNGHGLIFTDTEGGLFTSPNLRFDESGDGFQYTSTGEYSPTTQGVYFRLDDAFFRYRNNSLLNTDGKYCFVQFDDHKIKYNINNYAPYGPVDFIGDFTINGDLNRIDYHVSNEQADKSIWHIIDSLSYTIQFDGANSYPYAVPPTYVFNRDTVYFRNKLIVTDTIKTNKGIVFPDGSFQSTAYGVDCDNLHVDIYEISDYTSGEARERVLTCETQILTLKVRSNQEVNYLWSDNVMLSTLAADSADVYLDEVYTVVATNPVTGCTASDSVQILWDRAAQDFSWTHCI